MKSVSNSRLIVLTSAFLMVFGNMAFFSNVMEVYPPSLKNMVFLASLAVVFGSVTVLLLALVCHRHTTKPVLILILMLSSFASYFMDSYNVILDAAMIDNAVNTNVAESLDLLSFKLILYVVLLGVVPSLFVYKASLVYDNAKAALFSTFKLLLSSIVILVSIVFLLGDFYGSFIREHKSLRYYSNPSYYVYSLGKYAGSFFVDEQVELKVVGPDAQIPSSDEHRELVVLVVGETARADRFSLNGYERETNPYLKGKDVISYSNVWSCGTSTAVSVPCLFSIYDHSGYDKNKARAIENVLDVVKHAGVTVLWRDNNSSSKGVADRVVYEDFRKPEKNPLCDVECRDEGMLDGLQAYIDAQQDGDVFIVLHQMGNHGPAYYKRYPEEFEKFTPVCKTNQLESCSKEEIDNAYDNAILYTDYFLSKVIDLLEGNGDEFEAAMLYISDHGESLGEHGVYLHGMPYFIAPEAQTHVPMIMWFGSGFDEAEADVAELKKNMHEKYSHDNIFHTVLGLLEVDTSVYDKTMDLLSGHGDAEISTTEKDNELLMNDKEKVAH